MPRKCPGSPLHGQKGMSHPKTLQGSTDSETRAVTPTRPLVIPTCGFFRLSAGARGGRVLATTKKCTDARRTVEKTKIGVTQARAADSRQTKHKSSPGQNIANIFDPPGFGSHPAKPKEWLQNPMGSRSNAQEVAYDDLQNIRSRLDFSCPAA